jgi:hypothetical protein
MAYPEHMAKAFAETRLADTAQASVAANTQQESPSSASINEAPSPNLAEIKPPSTHPSPMAVALLLPFAVTELYPVADAIQRGVMAAQQITRQDMAVDIRAYASDTQADSIAALYQRALAEGASIVIGPLTRQEVTALARQTLPVPTLMLNMPEAEIPWGENQFSFSLQADQEAQQVVTLARADGMQNAVIISTDSKLSARIAQGFQAAWTEAGGQIQAQFVLTPDQDMARLQSDLRKVRADMIFLSADADTARNVRPFLDMGTPTFAISQIYNGIAQDRENTALNAIRFVDMPWLLAPDRADFAPYRKLAEELPPGDLQRWFALGVDAYHLALALAKDKQFQDKQLHDKAIHPHMQGLTGMLRRDNGRFSRELCEGRFSINGVMLERKPCGQHAPRAAHD